MSSIDERIVKMKFDNKQFEDGVRTTISALNNLKESLNFKTTSTRFSAALSNINKDTENLKKTLNFKDASKSFNDLGNSANQSISKIDFSSIASKLSNFSEKIQNVKSNFNFNKEANNVADLQKTVNKVDFSELSNSIDTIKNKFNSMGIVGITVMQNLTTMAMQTGSSILKAMSIQSIIDGYSEYETQINAVQTILANTKKEGTNIAQVNSALDVLNTYADKTIYNFTEMTRNIGTFTAAGVNLQTSVDSIQGIANLAAISGSSSLQASTAMYQLSQAIAAGTVKLMDWNSVVNAGMGGQVFQDALIRTSEHLKTGAKAAIEAEGSFRESLSKGWLTVDVLTETLKQFALNVESAEDYENAISDLVSQGYTQEEAENIADMAKTAMDAATKVKTFTQLIDTLKEELGSGWALSWRIVVGDFEDAKETWTEVANVLQTAISNSAQLRNDMLKGWSELGGRSAMIDGLKNIFEAIIPILSKISTNFRELFPRTTSKQLYELTIKFKEFTKTLKPSEDRLEQISRISKGLFSILSMLKQAVLSIIKPFAAFLSSDGVKGMIDGILELAACFGDLFNAMREKSEANNFFSNFVNGLTNTLTNLSSPLLVVGELLKDFGKLISDVSGVIQQGLGSLFNWISDNLNLSDLLTIIASGGIVSVASNIDKLTEAISKFLKNLGNQNGTGIIDTLKKSLTSFFKELGIALQSFTLMVNTVSLVAIASAIAVLVHSLKVLTQLDLGLVILNIPVIAVLIGVLVKNFKKLSAVLKGLNIKSTLSASIAINALALAINSIAKAMQKISEIPLDKNIQSILSIIVILRVLSSFLNNTDFEKKSITTGIALVAIASSLYILSKAIENIAGLSITGAVQGVIGVTVVLAALSKALNSINKIKISPSVAVNVLAISISLKIVSNAIMDFSKLSWEEMAVGLSTMAIALSELILVTKIINKFSDKKSIIGASAIIILTLSLNAIAKALQEFAKINVFNADRALKTMAISLAELVIVEAILSKIKGGNALLGAASILILVQSLNPIAEALNKFGSMSWDEIQRGITAMGLALLELSVISVGTGALGGIAALVGAGTILLASQGLDQIAEALNKFGSMSWDEIQRGITAMGLALLELSVISVGTGALGGIAALVGAGTILLASQGLDQIAEALNKFGSMSWDEIQRGITAMGLALLELSVGSFLNTLGILGSLSISTVAEPLGTLADSVKKWSDVDVPSDLDVKLTELSTGIMAFTLSGLGAGVISTVAEPLGTLADSVKKWSDVDVSEDLPSKLSSFAKSISDFSLAFLGGFSLSTITGPLGDLADSVGKWKDITFPDNFEEDLESLAKGIMSFSPSFLGGFSLSTITGPLGDLGDALNKWKDVKVPEGIKEQLETLSKSISVFNGSFITGLSLGSVTGPIGDLADAVIKWKDVTIPPNITEDLKALSEGINSFGKNREAMEVLNESSGSFGILGEGLKTLSEIDYDGTGSKLSTFVESIKDLPEQIASVTTSISDPINSLASSISSQTETVITSVTDMMNQITESLSSKNEEFNNIGSTISKYLTDGMSQGFTSQESSLLDSIQKLAQNIADSGITEFNSKIDEYTIVGSDLLKAFEEGAHSYKDQVINLFKSVGNDCLLAIKNVETKSFYNAGLYMMQGLQNGILDGRSGVIEAAIKVATDALKATKDTLDEASPSKATYKMGVYYDKGLINGMVSLKDKVRYAASEIGNEALNGLQGNESKFNLSSTATITPVISGRDNNLLTGLNTSKTVMFNAKFANMQIEDPINNLREAIIKDNLEVVKSNNQVLDSINGLRDDMSSYNESISSMENAMYIDGKKLASAIAKPMNQQLGVLSRRGAL